MSTHEHLHHPDHSHSSRLMGISIVLNSGFALIEMVTGVFSGSIALIADAGHNLTDVIGLLLAFIAMRLSSRLATNRYTYGLQSASILAALGNALLLMLAVGALLFEAVDRLLHPVPIHGGLMVAVAAVGVLINGVSAYFFAGGHAHDMNIRGAYLHMMADAGVSLGVVIGAIAISYTGWGWIDPVLCLLIAIAIGISSWNLTKDAVRLALQGVPPGIDLKQVAAFLRARPHVADVHDLHIWAISTTQTALSAHVVTPGGHPGDAWLFALDAALQKRFGIEHATLQVEISPPERHSC